ncbi:glycoside hydrolase family 3 C-terminal domain-containing protein [Streptomyces sp. NBC_00102]|uniref:glycoside hydrolase family 3 C-terminal domain-containing protein n=1 Tax=Streptomyces sp. NBC_00102 TaxID=2975652 RepID=UPI0022533AFF|nr:glycoside hydrolase family 3 C-terminal domain-containing protein [Streptomyces sp. NBC_00102]MCX5395706.1 glycoside hydrolase family 3 C-terminal domain-containing protein [Streptomyces sp. NBC_00102]
MTQEEIARLLDKLDPRQKVRLLTGATTWRTADEPAVGLRAMTMSDGPAGVRGESWDERNTSALLPCASAVGAMWDEDLAERLGALLAREAKAKGVDVVLAPTLNLHRSPLGGRHFECYSEDPELTARTGAALIRGIQAHGVAATAKHYVANDSETERLTVSVDLDERTLREVYLVPFEAAVRAARVRAVMCGYNAVNGITLAESPLLARPLKEEWGFDGVLVSDWGAVRSTAPAARAALDLVMPGPESPWAEDLLRAVEEGHVPLAAIDDKVVRLLRLADRVGALDRTAPARTAPPPAPGKDQEDPGALLRRAVAAGSVLLGNRGVLPLDPATLTSLAVIGAQAADPRVQGGGSAGVHPRHVSTPLAALRAALGPAVRVVHEPGPALGAPPFLGGPGCRDPRDGRTGALLRVLDADGAELYAGHRESGRQIEPPLPPGAHTVEISARLLPGVGGIWTLGVGGFGRMSLTVDGTPLVDGVFPRETDDPAVVHVNPPSQYGEIALAAGHPVLVVARRELAEDTGRATLVTAAPPRPDRATALARAVDAARAADAAVVLVGTTQDSESEGHDRTTLALPGDQDALVRAVIAAQPRTVVVVNSGGPVEMPWREEAPAVLLAWFPGQEAGAGLADVLLGAAEPGGRLPTTWPATLADAPVSATRPVDGVLRYAEGPHIGHRAWLREHRTPAYWFGHGLGYTTWAYESSSVHHATGTADGESAFTVSVRLRNTGGRPGREVVQVYLARPGSAVERPVRWLAGYAAVEAGPGGTVTAVVRVPRRALHHWSPQEHRWLTEPGAYEVHAGPSAGQLLLTTVVDVRPTADGDFAGERFPYR